MRILRLRRWQDYKTAVVEPFLRKSAIDEVVFWFRGQDDARSCFGIMTVPSNNVVCFCA
ncbi:MAG: hypothetical protein L0215_22030 [Gemmataceae bacterium]|nr:hypothetical protein [Gemmataceae bacterium]